MTIGNRLALYTMRKLIIKGYYVHVKILAVVTIGLSEQMGFEQVHYPYKKPYASTIPHFYD